MGLGEMIDYHSLVRRLQDPFLLVSLYLLSFAIQDSLQLTLSLGAIAITELIYRQEQTKKVTPTYDLREILLICAFPAVPYFLVQVLNLRLSFDSLLVLTLPDGSSFELIGSSLIFSLYIIPLFWRTVMKRESLQRIGFKIDMRATRLSILLLAQLLIPVSLHAFFFQRQSVSKMYSLLMFLKSMYLPGLAEELYYRGLVLPALRARTNDFFAVLLSALIFSAYHVPLLLALRLQELAAIFLLGTCLGFIYIRSQSIVPAVLFHGMVDGVPWLVNLFL
jgi:membrane protease YdiL (CAAX protease family)